MSTTVYFRAANLAVCDGWGSGDSAWNPNSAFLSGYTSPQTIFASRLSRGAVSGGTEAVAGTVASATAPHPFTVGSGGASYWVTPPLDRDVTISSTLTFNLWMRESNMAANIGAGCYIGLIKADGSILPLSIANVARGVEMAYGAAGSQTANNWTSAPTNTTACHRGDRLLIVPYFLNVGTQASGYSGFFYYDGDSAAASGDSYVTFTEDFGFIQDVGGNEVIATFAATNAMGSSTSNERWAFSIRKPVGKTLLSVALNVEKNGSPADNIEVAIQADSAGAPSGTDLTSASVVGSTLPIDGSATTTSFDFADLALTADQTYWMVVRRSGAVNASNYYKIYAAAALASWNSRVLIYNGGAWGSPGLDIAPGTYSFGTGTTLYPTSTASAVDPAVAHAASKANTAEGGSNTTAVTAGSGGNSGGTSGDYFNTVTPGSGGAITFDNAHPAHGSLGYKFVQSGSNNCFVNWSSLTGAKTYYFRGHFYATSFPASNEFLFAFYTGGSTQVARLRLASGVLQWQDTSAVLVGNTFTPSTSTLYRFEIEVFSHASLGYAICNVFAGDAEGAVGQVAAYGMNTQGGDIDTVAFGASVVAGGSSLTCWWDDIALGRDSQLIFGKSYTAKEMWTTRGSGATQATTSTAATPAAPIVATTSAGGNYIEWFSKPLTAFTLAGAVLINLRSSESNALANASQGVEIKVVNSDGTFSADWGYTLYGLEVAASEGAIQFFVSGDDISVTDGQRLRVRIFLDDSSAAAMASSYTSTAWYAGTSGGASGDIYLTFGQTLTEYVTGTNYAQAVDASLTGTMALVRKTGKPIAVVPAGVTVGLARGIKKPVPVTPTLDIAAAKRVGKPVPAAMTGTVGVARRTAKPVPAATTATVNLATQKVKQLAIAVTSTVGAALARTIVKPVAIATTTTVAFVRNVRKPVPATSTVTATLAKTIPKVIAATSAITADLARKVGKPLAVAATVAASMARKSGKALAVDATMTAALAKRVGKPIAVALTGTVGLVKTIPKTIAATVTGTVALARTIWKYIAITGGTAGTTPALQNTAEGGSNGTALTSGAGGNSGGASGDYFDTVNTGSGSTITFDNTHTAHGSMAIKFTQSSFGANSYVDWERGLSGKTVYARGYFYTGAFSSQNEQLMLVQDSGINRMMKLVLTTAGNLQFAAANDALVGTTYGISTGTLYRIECKFVMGTAGNGSGEGRVYLGDSTTTVGTFSCSGINSNGNDAAMFRFGAACFAIGNAWSCWWDDFGVGITDWLGPYGATSGYTVGLTQQKTVQKLVDATVTVTAAVAKSVGKAIQAAATATAALARNVRKPISVSSALDLVLDTVKHAGSQAYNQAVDVATTITAAISRRMPKAVDVASTLTAALARRTGKLVTVGLTGTVNLARSVGKLVTVGLTATVAVGRKANKLIAVALSPGFTLARKVGKPISVGGTMTVSLAKRIAKSVPVTSTVTAVVTGIKSVSQAISVGLTVGVSLARRTAKAIAPALSLTAAISRAISKPVAVALTAGVSLVRRTAKAIPVALTAGITILAGAAHRQLVAVGATLSLAIATAKTKLQAVAASMTGTVALTRRVGKPVAVGASLSVSLVRRVPRAIAVGTSLSVALSKRMARLVAVGLTGTVSLAVTKTKAIAVAVASTVGVAIRKTTTEAISVGLSMTLSIRRAMAKAVSIAVNPGVALTKSVGKRVSAATSLTVSLFRSFAKLIAASSAVQATLDAVANIANVNIPQAITVGLNAVVSISRAITHAVAVDLNAAVQVAKRMVVRVTATTVSTVTILTARTKAQLVAVATTIGVVVSAVAGKLIAATTSFAVDLVRQIQISLEFALVLSPRIRKAITKTVEFSTEVLAVVKALFSGFSTGKDHRGPTSARSTSPKATEADIGREGTDAVVDSEQTDADRWG